MLRGIKNILKKDGHLFISTPNTHCYKVLHNWINGQELFTYAPHPRELSVTYMKSVIEPMYDILSVDYVDSWGCHNTPQELIEKAERWLIENNFNTNGRYEDNVFILCQKS